MHIVFLSLLAVFLFGNAPSCIGQDVAIATCTNNVQTFEQSKSKLLDLLQKYNNGNLKIEQLIEQFSVRDLSFLIFPSIKLSGGEIKIASGVSIFNGVASGRACFSVDSIKKFSDPVVLVKTNMKGDDLGQISHISGIWLLEEDATSHASIVIRVMNKPCVTMTKGKLSKNKLLIAGREIKEGDYITIDGTNGCIYQGNLENAVPKDFPEFKVFMSLLDKVNKMKVYANADLPKEVMEAYRYTADGIDARTEHMFFSPDRLPLFRKLLFTPSFDFRGEDFKRLMLAQLSDFLELFKLSNGAPVTVRLLDPPPHEFLPENPEDEASFADSLGIDLDQAKSVIKEVKELNPMLGFRGARLLIRRPNIIMLQCHAMFRAAKEYLENNSGSITLKICVPMISFVEEIDKIKAAVFESYSEVFGEIAPSYKKRLTFLFGVMVETPRIALLSKELKNRVDFVSFGTNDLTALTFGVSRGDMADRYFDFYKEELIDGFDPFVSLDKAVMELVKMTKHNLENNIWCGLCGEQAIDCTSISFCQNIGMNSISCAPSMIPIAKLRISKNTLHLSVL